jgi:hypothetical protein
VCLGLGTDWGEDVPEEKMLPQEDVPEEKMLPQEENVSSKKIHS